MPYSAGSTGRGRCSISLGRTIAATRRPKEISISTVTALHLSWRNDPGLSQSTLYQKGLMGGRGSIEVVATLYLIISIGQILTSIYSQGGEPGLLQMEPILTEMASLLFMLLGFTLSLPLSALVSSRVIAASKR